MEVILKEDLQKLGEKGDVIKVKNGYGRNYLIPQGLALIANSSNKKIAEQNKLQAAHKELQKRENAEAIAAKIEGKEITIKVKASEDNNKIFGSITQLQISDSLHDNFGIKAEPKSIILSEPIKLIGDYEIGVKLHKEVLANIKLKVEKE